MTLHHNEKSKCIGMYHVCDYPYYPGTFGTAIPTSPFNFMQNFYTNLVYCVYQQRVFVYNLQQVTQHVLGGSFLHVTIYTKHNIIMEYRFF